MTSTYANNKDDTRETTSCCASDRAPRARKLGVSAHAIDRWMERVDRHCSRRDAKAAIDQILATGRIRSTPRRWLRRSATPGTTYAFSAASPHVCVIVANGRAVTVITRDLVRNQPKQLDSKRSSRRGLRSAGPERSSRRDARRHAAVVGLG
jgi:hypothetical protein